MLHGSSTPLPRRDLINVVKIKRLQACFDVRDSDASRSCLNIALQIFYRYSYLKQVNNDTTCIAKVSIFKNARKRKLKQHF